MKAFQCLLNLMIATVLTGCGTAWVVERREYSGTIGYQGFSSSESATKGIEALIPCFPYKTTVDRLVDGGTTTTYMPVQNTQYSSGVVNGYGGPINYSGQQTQTNYVPIQSQKTWRELQYECENAQAQISESRVISSMSCEEGCKKMFKDGELKKGETIKSCTKHLCD